METLGNDLQRQRTAIAYRFVGYFYSQTAKQQVLVLQFESYQENAVYP